jgi:flagellar motor protein MotB
MLFVVVLALLAVALRNAMTASKLEVAQRSIAVQVTKNLQLARALTEQLGDLVYVDQDTGVISIGEEALTFARNSNEIDSKGKRLLSTLVESLGRVVFSREFLPYLRKIVVEGHTDSSMARQDPHFNWRLSSRRALAVVSYMLDNSGSHHDNYHRYLEATGMADRVPIRDDRGRVHAGRSRRIEMRVVLDDKELVERLARQLRGVIQATHGGSGRGGDKE